MLMLNVVHLAGNLTRPPECKAVGETYVSNFGLAINRKYTTASGEKKEETTFIDCECWGKVAENVSKYLDKGSNVMIEGSLKLDTWEKDGKKHTRIKVSASRVHFISTMKQGEQKPREPAQYPDSPDEPPF